MAKAKKPATLAIVADLVNPTAHVFTSVGKVGLDPVDVIAEQIGGNLGIVCSRVGRILVPRHAGRLDRTGQNGLPVGDTAKRRRVEA